ncbi:MAG: DUF1559 domain-containing protein, partial [Thermoguttaceae bacterium]
MLAASLALFGTWGLYFAAVLSITALCLNRTKILKDAIKSAVLIIFIGIILPGLLFPFGSRINNALQRSQCIGHLSCIGLALANYKDVHKHYPPANICDKNGKPLMSWRVEILPMLEYGAIYDALRKDEPWNSPYNSKILSQVRSEEFKCPSANRNDDDNITNYMAVIGPGTIWREKGTVKLSDLSNGSAYTVAVVEVANSDIHWAEPGDLTVEEALEGLKTGKGVRISTAHPDSINVLFADAATKCLPAKKSLSIWKKLFAGEKVPWQDLEKIDESAPDMVDVSIHSILRQYGKSFSVLSFGYSQSCY